MADEAIHQLIQSFQSECQLAGKVPVIQFPETIAIQWDANPPVTFHAPATTMHDRIVGAGDATHVTLYLHNPGSNVIRWCITSSACM